MSTEYQAHSSQFSRDWKIYDSFVVIVILYYLLIKIDEVVKVNKNNGRVAKWLTAPDLKSDDLEIGP